jgi:hypothetical protein
MVAGDLLRLAWEAEHDGRTTLRDALMTLAVAESEPGDAWAERCRARLVLDRPDHFFGQFSTVGQALADPRVVIARDRLRIKYPPARVGWMLLRASARRGPYLGRVESLEAMIEDLTSPPAEAENVRRDAPQPPRGPLSRGRAARTLAWSLSYPPMASYQEGSRWPSRPAMVPDWEEDTPALPGEDFSHYYLSVLLGIAFLLASVQPPPDSRPSRG